MMNNFVIYLLTAFMMGLLGGVHCVGMCGGFVCALNYSHTQHQARTQFFYQLLYSLGRITTYTLLGAIMGLLGMALQMGVGGLILRTMTAVMMVMIGLSIAGWSQIITKLDAFGAIIWQPVSHITRYFMAHRTPRMAFALGSIWGLLPCGLVYSALVYSLSTGSWLGSAASMFSFGLGTLPALLLMGSAMQSYQHFLQNTWTKQFFGILLIVLGLLTMALLYWPMKMGHHCH